MPSKIRHRNKISSCPHCGKDFRHYSYDRQIYCSKECYYNSIRESRIKLACCVCNKDITTTRYQRDRNKNYYCNRLCYDNRRKEGSITLKRGSKYYTDLINSSSCNCGVSEPYLLQIHHINGNDKDHTPGNIEIVCGNCHIKRHLKINSKGQWVYHPASLTNRSLLLTL